MDSFTSAADASDAVVNADEAAIKTAELNLEYCTINSPIDGRTGAIMVKAGQSGEGGGRADRGDQSGNPIYVNFTVPQQYWPDIKEHMDRGALHVMATIPQDPGTTDAGHADVRGQRRGFHDRHDSPAGDISRIRRIVSGPDCTSIFC